MAYMLCRNRVRDFPAWKAIFDSHQQAQERAGLRLQKIWTSVDDPNNVFFLFQLDSIDEAQKFISDPNAKTAGAASGVLDGEYHFLQDLSAAHREL